MRKNNWERIAGLCLAGAGLIGCQQPSHNETMEIIEVVRPYNGQVEEGWIREGNWQYQEKVKINEKTYRKFRDLNDAKSYEHMQRLFHDSKYRKETKKQMREEGCMVFPKK